MALALRQHCQGRKWDFWTSCQNPELLDLRLKAYQMFCAVRNHSPGYYESWQRKKLLYFCIQFLDFCSSSVSRSMETIFPHFFPSYFFLFFPFFFSFQHCSWGACGPAWSAWLPGFPNTWHMWHSDINVLSFRLLWVIPRILSIPEETSANKAKTSI